MDNCFNIDEKLGKNKYNPDDESHLNPDFKVCRICKNKNCIKVCPASVYEWNEEQNILQVNYENCLECGACRIACEHHSLNWVYPKGGKGVTIKHG